MFIIFFIAEALFASLFIKAGYPKATKKGFCFKMFASAIFVASGIYAYILSDKSQYAVTVIIALIFGLLGDVFLTMDPFIKNKSNKKLSIFFIILGGLFFLAGHITYMLAFISELKKNQSFDLRIFITSVAVILLVAAIIKVILKIKLRKFMFPIIIYSAAISSMFALAVCLAVKVYTDNMTMQAILFSAPLLFIVSDLSLVLKFFNCERFDTFAVRIINLGTYFLAQMLFGLSISPI